MDDNRKILHLKYNTFYWLFFLVLLIIALITVKWGTIPGLVDLFTFGLTLTSLVLSLIAIIFALFSHYSFSSSVTNLNAASTKISGMIVEFTEVATKIEGNIACIPNIAAGIDVVKSGQEKLLGKFSEEPNRTPSKKGISTLSEEDAKKFLMQCSYSGVLVLYACHLAKEKKKPLKLDDLKAVWDPEYAFGFLVACASLDVVNYHSSDGGWAIDSIDGNVERQLEFGITYRTKRLHEKNPGKFKNEELSNDRKAIEAIFV